MPRIPTRTSGRSTLRSRRSSRSTRRLNANLVVSLHAVCVTCSGRPHIDTVPPRHPQSVCRFISKAILDQCVSGSRKCMAHVFQLSGSSGRSREQVGRHDTRSTAAREVDEGGRAKHGTSHLVGISGVTLHFADPQQERARCRLRLPSVCTQLVSVRLASISVGARACPRHARHTRPRLRRSRCC